MKSDDLIKKLQEYLIFLYGKLKEHSLIFLVPASLCVPSFFLFWNFDFSKALFAYLCLFLVEIVICEGALKRNRFFKIHRTFSLTFYSLLAVGGFFNLLIGFYLGFQYMSIFFGVSLITVLLGKKAGQASGIFFAALFFLLFPKNSAYFIGLILTGFLTARLVNHVDRRIDFAIYSFAVAAFKAFFFLLLEYSRFEVFSIFNSIVISITPIISAIVVVGLLPYVEWLSRVYSNIGMLELGNLNHPILKTLLQNAPGTYFHSFSISNLCESAAEKIGVNPILARVGAYFHDIGKPKKPDFFTENQKEENPHDQINPSMSHLILMEHIKYGKELSKKYRLPTLFEDLIEQHHGTRVQKFFYNKAMIDNPTVSEEEYRYEGPKPQFKEAGILMLADSCEAAIKSLKNPSPPQIGDFVKDIVNRIYLERELDDSGLTLKELELIIEEFTRSIVNISHKRVEYPKEKKMEKGIGEKK